MWARTPRKGACIGPESLQRLLSRAACSNSSPRLLPQPRLLSPATRARRRPDSGESGQRSPPHPRPRPASPCRAHQPSHHSHGAPSPRAWPLGAARLPRTARSGSYRGSGETPCSRLPTPSRRSPRTHALSRGPHPPRAANGERRPTPGARSPALSPHMRPMGNPT